MRLVNRARELMPDIDLTSDIIVGFPGETYEDFKKTVELVKEVGYSSLFTFIYSPRNGTPAAAMPDPVSRGEKGRWFSELLAVQDAIGREKEKAAVGKTVRVLCEEMTDDGLVLGKTDGVYAVRFKGDKSLIGNFANVRIDSYDNALYGTQVQKG